MALPAGVAQLGTFKGAKGDDGKNGAKGDKGDTGSLAFATAESVPADQPASVQMQGLMSNRGAHFKIPRGLPGVNAVAADEAVAAYLAASDSDTRGAASGVIAARTGLTVNVADYATLHDAINALPADGGTVFVPEGRFFSGWWNIGIGDEGVMTKSNVRIVGAKLPKPSANGDRLDGGSIIEGRFYAWADNFELDNVGFDAGREVSTVRYPGITQTSNNHPDGGGWDTFAFVRPTYGSWPTAPERTGVRITNVIGLLRDPTSYGHGILIEGIRGGTIDNVTGIGGFHGFALKANQTDVGVMRGYAASGNHVILKADSYASCGNLTIKALRAERNIPLVTPWWDVVDAPRGLLLDPQTASFNGPIQIGALSIDGVVDGLYTTYVPGNKVGTLEIGTAHIAAASGIAVSNDNGQVGYASIGTLVVANVQRGIRWNPLDPQVQQLTVGQFNADNVGAEAIVVLQRGRVVVSSVTVAVAPTAYVVGSAAALRIGKETLAGVTNRYVTAPTLGTTWTEPGAFGALQVFPEGFRLRVRGHLVSNGTGKTLATIPVGWRPLRETPVAVMFYNGAWAVAYARIKTDGTFELDGTVASGNQCTFDISWPLDS